MAAAVAAAMADAEIGEILAAAMKPIPQDTWFAYAMQRALDIVDEAEGNLLLAWMPLHDELWTSYKAAVSEAVAEAFGVLKLMPAISGATPTPSAPSAARFWAPNTAITPFRPSGRKNPATPPVPAFCLPKAWISGRLPTG